MPLLLFVILNLIFQLLFQTFTDILLPHSIMDNYFNKV